ncbi:MAG: sel1 repeat family protein [Betaproteobacteria bacterium]|nr:sel1 repeat family protein [Betaproteobacteria bacterium]
MKRIVFSLLLLGAMAFVAHAEELDYAEILTQRAESGDAEAQFYLGVMYESGRVVPQDYRQAVDWYRKAAEQGNADAQSNLVFMYYHGQGVPQDYVLAYALLNLAAADGHKDAAQALDLIAKEMTPAQIEEGQAIANQWRPGQPLPTSSKTGGSR